MGYRSDVMICLKKENFEELQKRVRKVSTEDKNLMERENFDRYKFYDDEDVVVFGWESLKWYPEYEMVKTVQKYLNELNEQDIDYKFLRVGEDYGDIELQDNDNYGCCDKFAPVQYIDIY